MNKLKYMCRLSVGDSFIFKGDYCIVKEFNQKHFVYSIQGNPDVTGYMNYGFYLKTPSAKGRQLVKNKFGRIK